MSNQLPSSDPGKRCLVCNISNENITIFSDLLLKAGAEVDLFVEKPTLTEQEVKDSMEQSTGDLYIETSIRNRIRIIDVDLTTVEIADTIYGFNNRIVFQRHISEISTSSGASTGLEALATGTHTYYVTASGLDTNDGLTWATAKRQPQSVFDLVPEDSDATIHLYHGPGTFEGPYLERAMARTGRINCIGDVSTPVITLTGAESWGYTTAGNVGFHEITANIGAYSETITDTSHWVEPVDVEDVDADSPYGSAEGGGCVIQASTSPNLTITTANESGAVHGTRIHTFNTFYDCSNVIEVGTLGWNHKLIGSAILYDRNVYFIGIELQNTSTTVVKQVRMYNTHTQQLGGGEATVYEDCVIRGICAGPINKIITTERGANGNGSLFSGRWNSFLTVESGILSLQWGIDPFDNSRITVSGSAKKASASLGYGTYPRIQLTGALASASFTGPMYVGTSGDQIIEAENGSSVTISISGDIHHTKNTAGGNIAIKSGSRISGLNLISNLSNSNTASNEIEIGGNPAATLASVNTTLGNDFGLATGSQGCIAIW